jgi:hypothetical protein
VYNTDLAADPRCGVIVVVLHESGLHWVRVSSHRFFLFS